MPTRQGAKWMKRMHYRVKLWSQPRDLGNLTSTFARGVDLTLISRGGGQTTFGWGVWVRLPTKGKDLGNLTSHSRSQSGFYLGLPGGEREPSSDGTCGFDSLPWYRDIAWARGISLIFFRLTDKWFSLPRFAEEVQWVRGSPLL